MECLSPITIRRPGSDKRNDYITVPCGKCAACLSRKRQQWSFRLEQELKSARTAHFITLTYDEQHLPYNENNIPSVSKDDVQKFIKRLRKCVPDARIRYYLVSEYGSDYHRPHYHFLLFDFPEYVDVYGAVMLAWDKGMIHIGSVTPQSINYCAKYCITKPWYPENATPTFAVMSRRPGIGAGYLTDAMKEWHAGDSGDRYYAVKPDGIKVALPRYYQEKLFSPESREHHREELEVQKDRKLYGVDLPPITEVKMNMTPEEAEQSMESFMQSIHRTWKRIEDIKRDYERKVKKNTEKNRRL